MEGGARNKFQPPPSCNREVAMSIQGGGVRRSVRGMRGVQTSDPGQEIRP